MSISRTSSNCRRCGKPLKVARWRALKVGPCCWADMTQAERRDHIAHIKDEDDPGYIPPERPASIQARVNNHNARAAATPDEEQLCRHENVIGRCADCRREADPARAAEMILRAILSQTHQQRRTERATVQAARVARGLPAPARPAPRPARQRQPATQPATTGPEQMELT